MDLPSKSFLFRAAWFVLALAPAGVWAEGNSEIQYGQGSPGGAPAANSESNTLYNQAVAAGCMGTAALTSAQAAKCRSLLSQAQAIQAQIQQNAGVGQSDGGVNRYGILVPDPGAGRDASHDRVGPSYDLTESKPPVGGSQDSGGAGGSGGGVSDSGGDGGSFSWGDPGGAAGGPIAGSPGGPGAAPVGGPPPADGSMVKHDPVVGAARRFADMTDAQKFEAVAAAAQTKLQLRDFAGALSEARQAASLQPRNAGSYLLMAESLNKLQRYAQAALAAQQVLLLDPKNSSALEQLAWAQLNLGRPEEALESAGRALKLNPNSARALYYRALAHKLLGHRREMLEDFKNAMALDPAHYGGVNRLAEGGAKLFDPNGDNSGLMDGLPGGGSLANPYTLAGLLMLLLSVLAGLAYALRRRLAWLQLPKSERAKRELAAAVSSPDYSSPAPTEDDSGRLAGKYQMTRIIGKGGMGQVWEAKDHSLDRPVAIKKMSEDLGLSAGKTRELYIKEARTLAALHHPSIVEIYEILDQPSGLYLVFELVSGKTLQHILAEKKSLPLAVAKQILKPVCAALQFAHEHGIAHRDLKPANVMVTEQGLVKVMDFGLARRTGDASALFGQHAPPPGAGTPLSAAIGSARTQTIAGTPAYMAPEAGRGMVTAASDVYALGVCLYEMLTGERPFGSQVPRRPTERTYVKASARVPGLSLQVDALIDAALEPGLEARLPSVKEFLARLEALPEPAPIG